MAYMASILLALTITVFRLTLEEKSMKSLLKCFIQCVLSSFPVLDVFVVFVTLL